MGASSSLEEAIFHYYIFQKKLRLYLQGKIYSKDNKVIKEGYILTEDYITTMKKAIDYSKIVEFLEASNIKTTKITNEQKYVIITFIKNQINESKFSDLKNPKVLENIEKILTENSENYLQRIVKHKYIKLLKISQH